MTILYKPDTGLIIKANAIYGLITKSQGFTTWSDLGNPRSPQFLDGWGIQE